MSSRSVDELRNVLLDSFGDYHSSVRRQAQWLEELIEAVRREERARCERERALRGAAITK